MVAVMLLLQIGFFVAAVYYFSSQYFYFYLACHILSVSVVLTLISRHENPSFQITWIVAIMTFPLVGGVFYLFLANRHIPQKLTRKLEDTYLDDRDPPAATELELDDPHHRLQSDYIRNVTGYPLCGDTSVEYFPVGERMFQRMLEELERAEHYIFLEFFIITPGVMWDSIFSILKRKAAAGVPVYMMYDDIGSISTMRKKDERSIRQVGIKLCVFNPFRPHVSVLLNYRDHRKIMVVDGKSAFCGGINIADEYINRLDRFGHWRIRA
jgi:cardiolipin synthase